MNLLITNVSYQKYKGLNKMKQIKFKAYLREKWKLKHYEYKYKLKQNYSTTLAYSRASFGYIYRQPHASKETSHYRSVGAYKTRC